MYDIRASNCPQLKFKYHVDKSAFNIFNFIYPYEVSKQKFDPVVFRSLL
jgi:hypothetical protein